MATKTVFQAGAVPQSLYNLESNIDLWRNNFINTLFANPQAITTSALQGAGAFGNQAGTYATGQSLYGSDPYYQQASNLWNQLGGQAYNLIGQGGQEYGLGQNLIYGGQQLAGQGAGTYALGQQMIPQGQYAFQQGQGVVAQGQNAVYQGQNLINQGQGLVGQGANAFTQGSGVFAQGITDLQNVIAQYPQIESQLSQLPSYQALMSTGLTPEQQAYVTQATQAQQAAVTQQLQTEGLGSSTMMQEKLGAAQQAGAATAGSLIQGNIQAATQAANAAANAVQERINQEQQAAAVGQNLITGGLGLAGAGTQFGQLGVGQEQAGVGVMGAGTGLIGAGANVMGAGTGYINAATGVMGAGTGMVNAGASWANVGQSEQALGLNSQSTGANYLNTIATANVGMQQQLYNEAMQGYGVLGQFLNSQLTSYGLSLQGEQIKGSESAASAQTSAALKEAQGSADAQGFSGLLSGIGSLLGGGKSGGGLFGSIGSLFGGAAGGGAAIAGGASTAVGGAAAGAAGGASAIGSALSVAGALFCAVGREIFGAENPEWYLMRDVMLFRAPKWLRKAYIRHARSWALYLSTRPRLKRLVRTIVRRIVHTLTHVESGIFTQ